MSNLKTHATALPLFGGLCIVIKTPRKEPLRGAGEPREVVSEEEVQRYRREAGADSKRRRERQKIAETLQRKREDSKMLEVVKRSNAALRHLAVFVNVVEIAKARGLPVALGVAKRIANDGEAVKQWQAVRRWLKERPSLCCVVSIGKGSGGWWVIRWGVLGSLEKDVFTEAAPLPLYLATKKGWKNDSIAMEAEAEKLLKRYLWRAEDAEETLKTYTTEMFEVYRAALVIPKTARTYKTAEARELLESCRLPVDPRAAYVVAYNGDNRNSSASGVALCQGVVKNGKVVDAEWVCRNEKDEMDDEIHDLNEEVGDF